jgi:tetratricopeptide (TPR) repeat protein
MKKTLLALAAITFLFFSSFAQTTAKEWYDKGLSLKTSEKYSEAVDAFKKATSLQANYPEALYLLGWCYNELEKYDEAVLVLKECVKQDNTYSDAYSELGYSYYELDKNDLAIANYRIAMALDNETDYHPILGMADVYYNNVKNYDSAIVYYEKGTKIQKTNKSAWYKLGWCYNDKEMYSQAIAPLQEAISLDADYNDARREFGYAYYKLEKYDDALAQFRPIMNSDAKDELSRYYAGFCYYLKGDQESLKKMIDELKAINTANSLKYVETLNKYLK